jgi:hypothetical protein
MAGQKFLKLTSGQPTEMEATQTSAGAGDAGKIPALDATGKFAESMMPVGVAADVKVAAAAEALTAGNLINLYNDTGTIKARKADASNGRRAHGFVLANVDMAANATVYLDGIITGLSAKTPGANQFLSGSTPGAATETPVTTAGYISQELGAAISATEISFEPAQPYTLA